MPEKNTLHLTCEEMAITFDDVHHIICILIEGMPIDFQIRLLEDDGMKKMKGAIEYYSKLAAELRGGTKEEFFDELKGSSRLKLIWLVQKVNTEGQKCTDESIELELDRAARAYLLYSVRNSLFAEKRGNVIHPKFLEPLRYINKIKCHDWGAAAFSYLYHQLGCGLCKSCRQIYGFLGLLEIPQDVIDLLRSFMEGKQKATEEKQNKKDEMIRNANVYRNDDEVEEVGIQIPKKRKGPKDAFVAHILVDFRPRAPTSNESKKALKNIHGYIADFFCENNIFFNCARLDSYSEMMQAIVQYNDPSTFKPHSINDVRVKILEKKKEKTSNWVDNFKVN
ncbi:hypothetical protein GIB67_034827 [Kingdonia uniflora]|uniref:Aminotransferase-like plant mobile domain-containing protein n=1 Tax=Kingdonia uniflora TaxID=39325 RepID=A0A7J7MDZ2_9MAGN|nr:hypothetical protein GIB67_034827 [Kingdonia uniflora]